MIGSGFDRFIIIAWRFDINLKKNILDYTFLQRNEDVP